jgi:hypothetical protein
VPFEVFEKLTSQYSEHSTGKVLKPGFVYISHYTTLTAWKFHSTIWFLLVLFKGNAFPFKNIDKSDIFQPKSAFTSSVTRLQVCFVLKQSVTVTSLNYKTALNWLVDFIIKMFFHQSDNGLLQIFALWLQKIGLWLQKIALWLQKITLWLQKIALLFGINCTEINQSQVLCSVMCIINSRISYC